MKLTEKQYSSFNDFREGEIWKDIEELDCDYQISNYGRIKSKSRYVEFLYRDSYRKRLIQERILRPAIKKTGDRLDSVQIEIRGITFLLSRLVYQYFIDDIPIQKTMCIAHIDKNPLNNSSDNLKKVTWSESKKIDYKESDLVKEWQKERSQRGANAMKRKAFFKKLVFFSPRRGEKIIKTDINGKPINEART
jgi:hypothetical protein